jgi:hypothetical protein
MMARGTGMPPTPLRLDIKLYNMSVPPVTAGAGSSSERIQLENLAPHLTKRVEVRPVVKILEHKQDTGIEGCV